jgi:hypothetical protein
MGKKLAFWGDCNGNGYKIIRILEELGGINASNYGANEVTSLYYIDDKNNIKGTYNGDLDKEKYVVMTYHDFIAKYPHQIYDIVYAVDNHEEGEVVEVVWDETKGRMRYLVTFENSTYWVFADDIFSYEAKDNSDCITDSNPVETKSCTVSLKAIEDSIDSVQFIQSGKIVAVRFNTQNYENEVELQLDDYEIEVRDGKTYAVKKKPKYPTTYAECCEVLVGRKPKPNEISFDKMELCLVDLDNTQSIDFQNPYLPQFNSLFRLRMCRDAYWKIYGEQMGLGKPWEPDLENEELYCIQNYNKQITISRTNTAFNKILIFPTEEIRDIFYKNFKDLIECCKELL